MYEAILINGWEADHLWEKNSIQNSRGDDPPDKFQEDTPPPRDRHPCYWVTITNVNSIMVALWLGVCYSDAPKF